MEIKQDIGNGARMKRTLRLVKRMKPCRFFGVVLVLLLSLSSLLIFQTKGSPETVEAAANPATLFEISSEMKVTFQICLNNEFLSSSKVDFQLGETVYLRLTAEFYRGGDIPLIANNTVFIISDDTGVAIWNVSMNQFGGGWMLNAGSEAMIAQWTPEKAGNYSAGVVFEETNYPNDFSKVMSFSVLAPSPSSDCAQSDPTGTQLSTLEATVPEESFAAVPLTSGFSVIAVIAVAGAGLPLYFKKRKHKA